MANTRISNLTASASNLAATDVTPVVQTTGVGPVKMTGLQIAGGLLGSTALTGATVTTSQPVLNLTQTWNASGVTFTGLRFNAAGSSDANSAAASLLLDLQVGGTSQLSVSKSGLITVATVGGAGIRRADGGGIQINGTALLTFENGRFNTSSSFRFGSTSAQLFWNDDTYLSRGGTATLQLGAADAAAPVAQTLQVQSVVAGTTNTAGTNFTINGSRGTGTGAGGSIIFQVASAGGSGTAQNAYATALTIDSNRYITIGGGGGLYSGSGNSLYLGNALTFGGIFRLQDTVGVTIPSTLSYRWSSDTTSYGTADVILARDAANTLALRNGTNAQRFNVYNTYTSSTNYETFKIDWITTANTCLIGTGKGSGGGTARDLRVDVAGSVFDVNIAGARQLYVSAGWTQIDSGRLDIPGTSAQIKLGGTGATAAMIKRSSTTLQVRLADDSANAAFEALSLKTSAPAGGTSGTWKVGVYNATAPSATGYVEVDIGGTLYKLLAST